MTRAAAIVLVCVLAAGLVVAIGAWAPWSSGGEDRPSRWSSAHRAVCIAARNADADKLEAARRVFYDGAHGPLHSLAELTAERDRSLAAKLLQAKQRVESTLNASTGALGAELRTLARDTRRAAGRIGDPIRASCVAQRL